MPSRNTIKQYLPGGYYHIYNRGVDKRIVSTDSLDYKMFLSYLKGYLTPRTEEQVRPVRKTNMDETIQLVSYALMPNHFHLLVRQETEYGIASFMRRITNAYTKYFNERNKRVGPLFQGKYKAILVMEEPYLLHLTRYIHLNPTELAQGYRSDLLSYSYSSYGEYVGQRKTTWIHAEMILSFFATAQKTRLLDDLSYQSFVEDYGRDSGEILGEYAIDHE